MKYLLLLLLSFHVHATALNGKLATDQSLGASVNSSVLNLDKFYGYSIMASVSSAAAISGSLKLQASNDVTTSGAISHWADLAGTSVSITGNAIQMYNVDAAYYKWVRVAWTYTTGSAILNLDYNTKIFNEVK